MEYKIYWDSIEALKIPNSNYTIKGHSIAATKTAFYIPELNIMLDCGVQNNFIPDYVFITHSHADHSFYLPMTFIELNNFNNPSCANKKLQLFIPNKVKDLAKNYIHSFYTFSKSNPNHKRIHTKYDLNGVDYGQQIDINIKNKRWLIDIIKCDHSVPCVGYGFTEVRKKLKSEYFGLSGRELGKLSREGVIISDDISYPIFCYLGDSTIKVFDSKEVKKYPTILVECTYLDHDDLELADKNKHIHWEHLEPIIEKYPNKLFVLYHFSKRYDDEYINNYFKHITLKNIVPWVKKIDN